MADDDQVRGTAEIMKLAEKGLELMKASEVQELEGDKDLAAAFKAEVDAKIAALKAEADALTGKDNKKARTDKGKEASELGKTKEYIDAERILKGLAPKNGNFVKAGQAAAAPKAVAEESKENGGYPEEPDSKKEPKKEKPKKAMEAAGISKAERDELEKLKNDIIALKKQLKEEGMSGGQMNKDERVVGMVSRMNELKEKENPGSTEKKDDGKDKKKGKALSADAEAEVKKKEEEIEEYRQKLQTEFKYSKKEISADPDMMDMVAELNKMKGGKK